MIKLLVQRELVNNDFARHLLAWKQSGFSQDVWASTVAYRKKNAPDHSMAPAPRSASGVDYYDHDAVLEDGWVLD